MIKEIKYQAYRFIAFFFRYVPHGMVRRFFVHYFRFHLINGYLAEYKIKKGDIIIDGGAFDGLFTFYAAKIVGKQGKIIAFEPDKKNFNNLMEQKIKNNLDNVILVNKGLWSEKKILKLSTSNSNDFMEASLYFDKEGDSINNKSMIDVPVTSLDYELEKMRIKKVDFIKMDIEGAEIEAIKGAKNLLKNFNVNLAIASYHLVDKVKSCFKLEKILKEYGYKVHTSFPEHLTTYAHK